MGRPKPLTVPPFESMADSLLEPPASHRWPSSQPFVLNSLGDPLAQPTVSCQGEHSAADPAAIIQRCMASVKATDTTSPAVVVERSSFPLSFLPRAAGVLEIPNRILKILAVAVRRLGAARFDPCLQKWRWAPSADSLKNPLKNRGFRWISPVDMAIVECPNTLFFFGGFHHESRNVGTIVC